MSNGSKFRVAALQLTSTGDVAANLEIVAELTHRASRAGAALAVLPENFGYLGRRERDRVSVAEWLDAPRPGPIVGTVCNLARKHALWIVAGGMPEKLPSDDPERASRTYNTCFVVSPTGEIAAHYRKIHLFDVDIAGHARIRESESTKPGKEVVVVETPLARLGLSICYDLRFPELYRELARLEAQLLLVPAAFTAHTGEAHWHTLLRARAIENQSFVLGAAQVGRHNEKRESWGRSEIIAPWGDTLVALDDEIDVAIADIDLDLITEFRRELPCHEHRVL